MSDVMTEKTAKAAMGPADLLQRQLAAEEIVTPFSCPPFSSMII